MFISIGIPFFNAENYLEDAIRSVFAQTYQKWELILIDDGSTDGSLEIARSIKDCRVRVYSDGENKKLPSRLNEIVSLARYDIIARMDADDLMSPFRLERQMEVLNRYSKIDLVSTGLFSISNSAVCLGMRLPTTHDISLNELLRNRGSGVLHAAILGRKEWFLRNRYDVTLETAQDYELWVRASYNNDFKIVLLKEPLYYYREEGNVTTSKLLRAYKVQRKVFSQYGGEIKFQLLMKSYIKTVIIYGLSLIGKTRILLQMRNSDIEVKYRDIYNKDLGMIIETELPTQT